jgi:DNA topoisomerase VI subunit B
MKKAQKAAKKESAARSPERRPSRAGAARGKASRAGASAQLSLVPDEPPAIAAPKGRAKAGAKPPKSEPAAAPAPAPPPAPAAADPKPVSETAPRRSAAEPAPRRTAAELATKQREISVSEFFTKNRHLLGFDNPAKALLTTVKEAVDNSFDACEEAGILPEITISIFELSETRYRVVVEDNGPGIVRNQIPKIFGQLLYGSKFHRLRQSRGQQGIGISAAGMYGQLTTGKPIVITSKTGAKKPAHHFEIQIDTRKNQPVINKDTEVDWASEHGTRVELEIEATYKKGKHSVDGYIELTALANPHATITYHSPKGEVNRYDRVAHELPREPKEIQPHPHGIELGILLRMLQDTKARNVHTFLTSEFSRVSAKVADDILTAARIAPTTSPGKVSRISAETLFMAIGDTKLMAPPTNCLSPIGDEAVRAGLAQQGPADFVAAVTRPPAVYRGNPFQVEVGIAYGGQRPADELAELVRFANRVPLLYQQSACAITRAVLGTSWKSYGIQQSRGALPTAPMLIMVHIASVWVPFTSESKEAIASYPEIVKEIKLGLQECGRRLGTYLRRGAKLREAELKRSYIEKYIPHIGIALKEILGLSDKEEAKIVETLKDTLERSRTV